MLKLQYFGHLMQRTDSLEKTLMLEGLKAGGEGADRGWDCWMSSLMWWTWVWASSRSWWWTGKPGMLQRVSHESWTRLSDWTEMSTHTHTYWTEELVSYSPWGCKRVGHNLATKQKQQQQQHIYPFFSDSLPMWVITEYWVEFPATQLVLVNYLFYILNLNWKYVLKQILLLLSCFNLVRLCGPMDCSRPGSSVHGILQARILKWVAMPSSKSSSQPKDRTQISCIAGRFFTIWASRVYILIPTSWFIPSLSIPFGDHKFVL